MHKLTNEDVEVIYICGYGRSGSTLLDTLMGNHKEIFGAGELCNIFDELQSKSNCSCGEIITNCEYWKDVMNQAKLLYPELNASKAQVITRKAERFIPSYRAINDYGAIWNAVLNAIFRVSEKRKIVDSSKSSRLNWNRYNIIKNRCGFKVKAIHLVRDPRAVMWSVKRGSNKLLEQGRPSKIFGGMIRGLIMWTLINTLLEIKKFIDKDFQCYLVRYEDIVGNPYKELRKIALYLNIDINSFEEIINNDVHILPGHGVSGNRMRRKKGLTIKNDQEWKNKLPFYAKLCSNILAWPLMKKYKYIK